MIIEKTGMLKIPFNKITPDMLRAYTYIQNGTEDVFSTIFKKKDYVYFPRNVSKLKKFLPDFKIKDLTITKSIPKRESYIELRDYQKEIINQLFNNYKEGKNDNIIELATGGGKTFMLADIIPKLQQKTLIVVDMTMLAEQMFTELSTNTNLKISMLDRNMNLDSDVVITTFQFLNQNDDRLEKIKNEFGLIVVDEVHIAGAKTITKVIQSVNARYRIGLSATPTRSDGLDDILIDLFEHRIVGKIGSNVNIKIYLIEDWRV